MLSTLYITQLHNIFIYGYITDYGISSYVSISPKIIGFRLYYDLHNFLTPYANIILHNFGLCKTFFNFLHFLLT